MEGVAVLVSSTMPDERTGRLHEVLRIGGRPPPRNLYIYNQQISDINIASAQGIGFNEFAAGLHFVAHQHGEDAVRFNGVIDLHFE